MSESNSARSTALVIAAGIAGIKLTDIVSTAEVFYAFLEPRDSVAAGEPTAVKQTAAQKKAAAAALANLPAAEQVAVAQTANLAPAANTTAVQPTAATVASTAPAASTAASASPSSIAPPVTLIEAALALKALVQSNGGAGRDTAVVILESYGVKQMGQIKPALLAEFAAKCKAALSAPQAQTTEVDPTGGLLG